MVPTTDFSLRALYHALEEQRQAGQLTWAAVADQVNNRRTTRRPISASTMTGLEAKPRAEGDGVLQMLIWLDRSPESFVGDVPDSDAARYRLPRLTRGQILRWDTEALHRALDTKRRAGDLTWADVARELRGFTPTMLTNLSRGPRIGFPRVMRLVRWLGEPAVTFTRIDYW
jgi:hypothetical protein